MHSNVNIIYLDPALREVLPPEQGSTSARNPHEEEVEANLRALLRLPSGEPFFSASTTVRLCHSIFECTSYLQALEPIEANPILTVILVHICHNTAAFRSPPQFNLQDVTSEINQQSCYNNVIPIALVSTGCEAVLDTDRIYRNQGAADVLLSPLNPGRVLRLRTILFNICRDLSDSPIQVSIATRRDVVPARIMVQDLAGHICNPDHATVMSDPRYVATCKDFRLSRQLRTTSAINFNPDRQAFIAASLSSWSFSAHDLSDEELLFGASLMLQHVLKVPALGELRMTNGKSPLSRMINTAS